MKETCPSWTPRYPHPSIYTAPLVAWEDHVKGQRWNSSALSEPPSLFPSLPLSLPLAIMMRVHLTRSMNGEDMEEWMEWQAPSGASLPCRSIRIQLPKRACRAGDHPHHVYCRDCGGYGLSESTPFPSFPLPSFIKLTAIGQFSPG